MAEKALIVSRSLKDVEVQSTQEVINQSIERVSVPAEIVMSKNRKEKEIVKKTVNARKKMSENEATREKTKDDVSSTIINENTSHSEQKNLSENFHIVKQKQVLIVSINLKYVEVRSTKEVINRSNDSISVPVNSVGRKNQMESEIEMKTVNAGNKSFQNKATTEKTTDKVDPMIVCQNTNSSQYKNLSGTSHKRKISIQEHSEKGTKLEAEDNTSPDNISTKNFDAIKGSTDCLERKRGKKKKSVNFVNQKTEDDENGIRRENESDKTKKSTSKTVLPEICEMLQKSEACRLLRKPSGTSYEEISKIVAEKYQVEKNRIKPLVQNFCQRETADGWCEKISGNGGEEKFRATPTLYSSYKKSEDNDRPIVVFKNTNSSEHENLSGICLKRKATIEEQSENEAIAKNEQVLMLSVNLRYLEVRNTQEITIRSVDTVSVLTNNGGRSNQKETEIKKKTVISIRKKSKIKAMEMKTADNAIPMIACENVNFSEYKNSSETGFKRKAKIEEQSENDVIYKHALIVSINLKYVKVRNTKEVTNRFADRVSVPTSSAGGKNQMESTIEKKTVNDEKKNPGNKAITEKMADNVSSMFVCENTESSENKNLSGTDSKRKASMGEQSEKGLIVNHEHVLIVSISLKYVKVRNTQEVTNRSVDRVSVPAVSTERKNQKKREIGKKTVNANKKYLKSKSTKEQKTDNASSEIVCENANTSEDNNLSGTGHKRKVSMEEKSENGTEKNKEQKDSTERPKRKCGRKRESENIVNEKTEDDTNENIERKVKENKTGENTITSEDNNLSGTGRKRKVSIEEQSENGTEKNQEQKDSTERPKRKCGSKKKTENIVNEKTEDDANENIKRKVKENKTGENTNTSEHNNLSGTGCKRKVSMEEQSENCSEKNKEQKDSMEHPTRKCGKKNKCENVVNEKTEDDTNENIERKDKENKTDKIRKYTRKTALPSICEMLLESEAWKLLRNPRGTSLEEISEIVAEKYQVEINRIKPLAESFYQREIANGWCEQVRSCGDEEKIRATNTLYFSYKGNEL